MVPTDSRTGADGGGIGDGTKQNFDASTLNINVMGQIYKSSYTILLCSWLHHNK